jgi:membrane associated rhomboid family serine protease
MTAARRPIIVPIFILINAAVYLAWSNRNWLPFMLDNFAVSWELLQDGHYANLITSVFSHNYLLHIFINMYVLHSFGSILELVLGRRRFFVFYIVAGIVSSLSHCLVSAFVVGKPEMLAVGASGSISGLVLLFALLYPREKLLLFGFIPLPAMFGALAFVGLDVWGVVAQAQGGGLPIGHGAHLGGAFTGLVYYLLVLRPRLKR